MLILGQMLHEVIYLTSALKAASKVLSRENVFWKYKAGVH